MKRFPVVLALATIAAIGCGYEQLAVVHAQGTLQSVLDQMDKASASFRNATADLHQEVWLKAIHSVDTVQNGRVYFERSGGSMSTGLVLSVVGSSAKPDIIEYANNTLRDFKPGPDTVDVVKLSGSSSAGQALGFGGSGKDLAAGWNITDMGPETINGTKTEKLNLTPKDPKVAQTIKQATMWIDPVQDVSLKQIIYAPNGDYRTATYSNIKVNTKIDKGPFTIKTDKNTKINQH